MPEFLLRAEGISVRYGWSEALRPLSLEAAPGSLTLVLGANGAGKSTLVRTLVREGSSTPRQFFGTLVERFGAKRIMWGSNYPARWSRYGDMKERLSLMRDDFSFLSEEDRRWIFGETALSLWPTLRGAKR